MDCVVRNKVTIASTDIIEHHHFKWKPFLRQLLIGSNVWSQYFCLGLQFGTTTVLVPQLRRANITISDEMISWLSAGLGYAAIPWIIILALMARNMGRKKTCIFISLATIASNIVFCFSTTPTHLLISEVIYGVTQAAANTIFIIVLSEYTSPKYRGMFFCVKSASFYWGIWVANALGTFTFWRCIPIVSLVVSLYSLSVFYWPESPYWLASMTRFSECREAHRWLKEKSENTELELSELIQSQTEFVDRSIRTIKFMLQRDFYLPLFISMVSILSYHVCGKLVISAYAIDMIKKIIKGESTIYYTMLILDGITVFCAYVGCFITKQYKRRTIWLAMFTISISFLLILSLYIYFVKLSIMSENVYLSICLLSGYCVSIGSGPLILATSLPGELISYRYKSISFVIVALWYDILYGIFLKFAPLMVKMFSLHGTFLFYALSAGSCTCIMYFYLPETKDKTLIEIEKYFKDRKTNGDIKKLVVQ